MPLLERVPLSYEETALETRERIELLWLKGGAIRAGASGTLCMADLLAPHLKAHIRFHSVLVSHREKAFQEPRRSVVSLLGRGSLAGNRT